MMMIMIIDLDFNVILWIRKNHVKYSKDSKDQTCSLGCFDATHIPIIPPDAVEFIKTETQNTQPWALYQLPAKISTLENFCISGMSSCQYQPSQHYFLKIASFSEIIVRRIFYWAIFACFIFQQNVHRKYPIENFWGDFYTKYNHFIRLEYNTIKISCTCNKL